MKRGTTLEEFKADFENKRHSVKGFSGLLKGYCETDIVSTATRFDKEYNRFKEKYFSLEKIMDHLNETLVSKEKEKIEAERIANSYTLPCLKKEFEKKSKILNKILEEISYLEEMKTVFSTFEKLSNIEQFYSLFKYNIIRY